MESEEQDYIKILRNHGLQVTYQRLAIYRALRKAKEHLSAEQVCQEVRKRFPMMSLGTVYKTLERFCTSGVTVQVGPITNVALYEVDDVPHHHFVCTECQTIQNIEDATPQQLVTPLEENDFEVQRRQVTLYGLCKDCRQMKMKSDV